MNHAIGPALIVMFRSCVDLAFQIDIGEPTFSNWGGRVCREFAAVRLLSEGAEPEICVLGLVGEAGSRDDTPLGETPKRRCRPWARACRGCRRKYLPPDQKNLTQY